jgi:hypothetical protein
VSNTNGSGSISVVDIDQAFPNLSDRQQPQSPSSGPNDVGPQVNAAIRDALGWRPRVEDPKAFVDALTASFRLVNVQGHVEAQFVARGYAVQADLGAVTGGQASLYRRSSIARTEILRILDGQAPLRSDGDVEDMEAYRTLVRCGVDRLVDEIGAAGGPRVQVVDSYFRSLTGRAEVQGGINADTVAGQLGGFREQFSLLDANVNNVDQEGVRTAFVTMVDMVLDLRTAWQAQRGNFSGADGQGFLGTELILLSRRMEAAADQVEELEVVFDSVSISQSERRTLILDPTTQLTLDGLMGWMRSFLTDEGRRIAQDAGRVGILSALVPTLIDLFTTFKKTLSDKVDKAADNVIRKLPSSCSDPLPVGLYTARSRIAITSTCRLLKEVTQTAQHVSRYPAPVVTDVMFSSITGRNHVVRVEVRGINFRSNQVVAFVPLPPVQPVTPPPANPPVLPLAGSSTVDDDSLVGVFKIAEIEPALPEAICRAVKSLSTTDLGKLLIVPAEDLQLAVLDGQLGRFVHSPEPLSWPQRLPADVLPKEGSRTNTSWCELPDVDYGDEPEADIAAILSDAGQVGTNGSAS